MDLSRANLLAGKTEDILCPAVLGENSWSKITV